MISPHYNSNSFSSRIHFQHNPKLNKTGEQIKISNKVSKENIKFHYIPSTSPHVISNQRKSETEAYHSSKPNSVNMKIQTREKKYLLQDSQKKGNKSEIEKKYFSSNDSYELDAQIAADLEKILKQ